MLRQNHLTLPRGVGAEEVKSQLGRILKSEGFRRSERMSRFLKHVVEEGMRGNLDTLKEYSIALSVFDKPEDFEPRADPIVRVEAGRLRAKIREYYATDGADDSLFIGIRKRGYRPLIHLNKAEPAPASNNESIPEEAEDRPSIAVLGFCDLSARQTQDQFCEALAHSIANALARERSLRVSSRTGSMQAQSQASNIQEIATRLGVDYLVEGSVQRLGDKVRLTAELTRAKDAVNLWATSIDRELDDIFQLQDSVKTEIVEGLRKVLLCGDDVQSCEEPQPGVTVSPGYPDFVTGMKHWSSGAVGELRQSSEHFERACRKDPEHAEAWAGLASARVALALSRSSAPGALMAKAKTAARKALELNENLAEAHAAIGVVHGLCEFHWEEAEPTFECARALSPELPIINLWYALGLLLPYGNLAEATAQIEQAHRADPTSALLHYYRGLALYFGEAFEDAKLVVEVAVGLEPDYGAAHLLLGDINVELQRYDEAIGCYEKVTRFADQPTCGRAALGYCYTRMGRLPEARKSLKTVLRATGQDYAWPYDIAVLYGGLGDTTHALEWLDRSCEDSVPWLPWLRHDPKLRWLQQDARFEKLLSRMNLAFGAQAPAA